MADVDFMKQAQEYYAQRPAIIPGTGASSAYRLSGMGGLAQHLINSIERDQIDAEHQGI